ncbi:MAG: hypothetical protein GXY44_02570 [Phycisphaerales bacterium]|nr:hypothetical protein [Phycisphaerales bacterium]
MRWIFGLTSTLSGKVAKMVCGTLVGLLILTLPPVQADDDTSPAIVRVEEDWILVLNEPNDAMFAPQFHTVMSPFGHLESVYLQVIWNYWEYPEFEPGGLQMQAWDGGLIEYEKDFHGQQLSTNAETVSWTQVLETDGTVLTFRIENGHSQTWGNFGGEYMQIHGVTNLPNLNRYLTNLSVVNSLVTYGANRVDLFAIAAVRYYSEEGLIVTDNVTKVITQAMAD